MPQAYVKPGVSVSELVNPSFTPIESDPTTVCIIGVGAGYQSKSEVVQLLDNAPVALAVDDGIDLGNLTVRDYADRSTVYVQGVAGPPATNDFYLDGNSIVRSMATDIRNGETVLITGTNTAGQIQDLVTLNDNGPGAGVPLDDAAASGTDTISDFVAQRLGRFSTASGSGTTPSNTNGIWIQTNVTPVTLRAVATVSGAINENTNQRVYVDYIDVNGSVQVGVPVDLNGTTPVAINSINSVPNAKVNDDGTVAGLVVRNVNDPTYNESVVGFTPTSDSTGVDSPSGKDITVTLNGTTYTAYRPSGPSSIPSGATVLVEYTATPQDYFFPTRCFGMGDVEAIYGPGLAGANDPDGLAEGSVKSPVSFAAQLAFANGAPSVVIQPLYSSQIVNNVTIRSASIDPGTISDWNDTLEGLRSIDDVNVLVPLVSTNGVGSDSTSLGVFNAIQNHINFMITQNYQFLVAVLGEDSTIAGQGSMQTLRSHAKSIGGLSALHPECISMISPAAFKVVNPVTGLAMTVGGQYAAAAFAGALAAAPVAATETRHTLGALIDVVDARTEADKDTDAKAGLTVIENKRGIIMVRHALTTAVNSKNTSELSVIRAKHFMIETIRQTLDEQVIGQIVIDNRAAFTVQLLVEATLEQLVQDGVIATYDGTQAQLSNLDPTTITVRFSYLPLFPLNYVNIQFAIDASNSGITVTDTSTDTGA